MNNGQNPNENNNFSNNVLGSVENFNNINNVPMLEEVETLEVLDTNVVTDQNIDEQVPVMGNNNIPPVQPVKQPEPAYTNPQNINPMPGFEPTNTIGVTPPISLEPEKQPKKKKTSKVLFVILIVVVLFGVGFGTFYILKYTDILNNSTKITIVTKNLEVNINGELSSNINDYATVTGTDIKNCILEKEEANLKVVGSYQYKITCGEIYKTGTINVVDNTELIVEVQNVYKTKESTIDVKEFILNPNSEYTYEFVNGEEVNNILKGEFGEYTVKIKATKGEKTKEVEAKLIIMQYEIKGSLICKSNPQNLENSSTTKTLEESFVIVNDGDNGFGGITLEKHIFKFMDETEYSNYLTQYNSTGRLSIDNIEGTVVFDDANLAISISNYIPKDEIILKYGAENMINYRTIRSYFTDTLKYSCSFK